MRKTRALVLFSGGLDSILAAKLLQKQKIKVFGLTFVSCFFNAENAKKAAKKLKIPLKIIDFSKEHLEMVKNPKHGYGKNLNPCLDCHTLMLKKAKEIMEKENFDFVATGEVLGERPFSQNLQALKLIEKESGLNGYLLRPLSAQLLEPTIVEKQGLVDRSKLLNIYGRSRKKQLALAKEWKIKEYPTPAGGCLLTDPGFSQRLKEMFKNWPDCNENDIELLKLGRIFWFSFERANGASAVIVVGRNQKENQKLEKLAQSGGILIELKDIPGPTTLIRIKKIGTKKLFSKIIRKAEELTQYYSTKARNKKNVSFILKEIRG